MVNIGDYNELEIAKEVDFGVYLDSEDGEILLPEKYVPPGARQGDTLRVFVYRDSEDRMIATTLTPKARVGEFAALEVKQTNAYGAFLDWGLEKDLFVPFQNQREKMQPGRTYLVYVYLDETSDRIVATAKLNKHLQNDALTVAEGDEVNLMVAEETDLGFKVIVNQQHQGILYHNEVFQPLGTGQHLTGYIKKIREDNKIDVTLRKPGYDEVVASARKVIQRLRHAGGVLPLSDRSSPDEIQQHLQMSKKTFKKAIGSLYKRGEIEILPDHIRLNDDQGE
jgi:predicted RNA-binding protein (virulence factor B family)